MPRPQMRSTEDELDKVSRDIHEAATRTRDVPVYADPAARDYNDVTMRVSFEVSGMKVAAILQTEISRDRIGATDDATIQDIVTRHFQEEAAKPVKVDLSPYHDRVRSMGRGGAALPPVTQTWPKQPTGEQQ